MKFSLIVAVALLALAHGSLADEVTDLERLQQYFEDMRNKMTEMLRNYDLPNQAQTFMQEKAAQLEPLAAQVQEQLKAIAANAEEQFRPLASGMQAHLQPMVSQVQQQIEAMYQGLKEQDKSISN